MPKRRYFSESFKESALEYYQVHGLKESCQKFDVDKTLLLAWRRKAGAEKSRRKSRHKSYERNAYSPEYKLQVLRDANLLGPEKAAVKHGISSNLIYCWKIKELDFRAKVELNNNNICDSVVQDGKSESISNIRCNYTPEFKISVLCDFNSLGATKTAEKYKINPCLIYKWKEKEIELQKQCPQASGDAVKRIRICKRMSIISEYQREVLDYFVECGPRLTMKKFAITQRKLHNWRKKFNDQYGGKLIKTKHYGERMSEYQREVLDYFVECGQKQKLTMKKFAITQRKLHNWRTKFNAQYGGKLIKTKHDGERMLEVVEYANNHGSREATLKYGVSLSTILNWKAKLGKKGSLMKRKVSERKEKAPRRSVDEVKKSEIIQTYAEEGSIACEKKYNIPRQTIRNWAIKRGTVKVSKRLVKDALQSAQENGVQSAVAKFSISRASLYNWAKKFGMNMSKTNSERSITLKVSDGKKERNIVFYKKKIKPVTIKFQTKPEKKPKENKRKKEEPEPELQALPDWVLEFIKKKVPKLELDQTQIVLRSNETVFEGEEFTISTPDFAFATLDHPLESSNSLLEPPDVSSDPEYECDYVELDLFTALPFFTPSNDLFSIP